jgi:hypothetical protein
MRNKTKLAIACGLLTWMAGASLAQAEENKTAEPAKFFHLDFVVQELESGKVVNARHYATTISTGNGERSDIRTGNKVPVATNDGSDTTKYQYTYIDVGVNLECRGAKEIGGDLALNVTAEISSAVTTTRQPIIRQTKWSSDVIVPMAKPTIIFSSDDVATKGQMRLELTATPVK